MILDSVRDLMTKGRGHNIPEVTHCVIISLGNEAIL